MRVLFLTKYTRKGASSRLRTFQYLEFLRQNDIECEVSPFFNDEYLEEVYQTKSHNKWIAFKSFLRRIGMLLQVGRYDKVVIEKELFPYFPSVFEWVLHVTGVQFIVDYDDAIFHNYDLSDNFIIRTLLKNKIRNVVRFAHVVVAGNKYLKGKFEEFGARRIVLIPTVIDIKKYALRETFSNNPFTIGWIGSPITFKYLYKLREIFESLSRTHLVRIVYIGANKTLGLPNEEIIPWNEEEESNYIRRFDVGIMPLEDNIWERGKCGYKLIQYMGCGIPVVGTPIGVNEDLITDNVNGFKATSDEEWKQALERLIQNDPAVNSALGTAGRNMVEKSYSLEVYSKVWLDLLKDKPQANETEQKEN